MNAEGIIIEAKPRKKGLTLKQRCVKQVLLLENNEYSKDELGKFTTAQLQDFLPAKQEKDPLARRSQRYLDTQSKERLAQKIDDNRSFTSFESEYDDYQSQTSTLSVENVKQLDAETQVASGSPEPEIYAGKVKSGRVEDLDSDSEIETVIVKSGLEEESEGYTRPVFGDGPRTEGSVNSGLLYSTDDLYVKIECLFNLCEDLKKEIHDHKCGEQKVYNFY